MKITPLLGLSAYGFFDVGVDSAYNIAADPDATQVAICARWIDRNFNTSRLRMMKHPVSDGPTSYFWKHVVEIWAGQYIANGAFIRAAIDEDLRWQRVGPASPNAVFNFKMPRPLYRAMCVEGGMRAEALREIFPPA